MSRYLVVAGLFVLSVITYVDRAAISSVTGPLSAELSLNSQEMGAVFSVFALGYAAAQIPSGWLADRAGPRLMLAGVVAIWSLLTAWTGRVDSFSTLLVVRFLFGVAEAGAFPGTARAFFNWLPASERGRANGIVFSGSRLGAAGAFPLMAWLLSTGGGWRQTFFLLAVPGFVWALLWLLLFRDRPRADSVASEPPSEVGGLRLGEAIRTRPMQLAMLQYFGANFTTFLCLSWMNPYLKQRYALTTEAAAFYTMLILLVSATAQWATGFLVDRLYASGRRGISRSAPATIGFAISAAGALLIPFAPDASIAAACFSLAAFGVEMTISPSWAFCVDLGGRNSGAVSGAMNTAGNFGSFVSANAFPWLQGVWGDATPYFFLVCALNVFGCWCWRGMRLSSRQSVQ
jgi:MFS transporter, ACS family, glucarate transporter